MPGQSLLDRVESLSLDKDKSTLPWNMDFNDITTPNPQRTDITHSSNTKFYYFFDLPPELREQIVEHVCLHPGGVHVINGQDITTRGIRHTVWDLFNDPTTFNPYVVGPPVNLMLACTELYRVASGIYYGRNVFHLRLAHQRRKTQKIDRHGNPRLVTKAGKIDGLLLGSSDAQDESNMGSIEGPRLSLRHVVVRIERFGGTYLEKKLIPALGYMVLNGRLRRLEVEVPLGNASLVGQVSPRYSVFERQQDAARRTMALRQNPVMKALLVVLSDPYLEKASMRVHTSDSPSFWCQCHAPEVGWGEKSEDKPPMCFLKHLAGETCCRRRFNNFEKKFWAEVDIPKLVQACGIDSDRLRIKTVEAPDPFF
ncbi:hypothetical protein QBC41DRAFT_326434 [Cercophora samala]|uniref:Uncharacterized protein n=1 Tax=Cercophora samala TaxID=330535 RepID=A0AA39Z8E1_9PEZI|nr:hypothetical protein QBC41DRAFT_326434 [Cercophora samala]